MTEALLVLVLSLTSSDADAAEVLALIQVETGGVARPSPVGARGLLQIMPATWDDITTRRRPDLRGRPVWSPGDVSSHLEGGIAYWRWLGRTQTAGSSTSRRLAAWNGGFGRVRGLGSGERLTGPPEALEALPGETRACISRWEAAIQVQALRIVEYRAN